jgi:hypothetical protein
MHCKRRASPRASSNADAYKWSQISARLIPCNAAAVRLNGADGRCAFHIGTTALRVRHQTVATAAPSAGRQLASEVERGIGQRLLHTDRVPHLHAAERVVCTHLGAARDVTASLKETRNKAAPPIFGTALRLLRLAQHFGRLDAVDIPLLCAAVWIGGAHQFTASRVIAVRGRMGSQAVFGKHIAAAPARSVNKFDAGLIPTNIATIGLDCTDIRTACGILTTWFCMHHKATACCSLTGGIAGTEAAGSGNTGRVPIHAAAERVTVAHAVAAGHRTAARSVVNDKAALRLTATAARAGDAATELQRLAHALHIPDDVAAVGIKLAHRCAALRVAAVGGAVRQAAITRSRATARKIRTEQARTIDARLVPAGSATRWVNQTHGLAALWIAAIR